MRTLLRGLASLADLCALSRTSSDRLVRKILPDELLPELGQRPRAAADHLTDEDWHEIDDMVEKIEALRISTTVGETQLWLKDQGPE
jgi:hypothetical protein